MRLPRDLSGANLIAALKTARQAHLTIPLTKALPAGTLATLIKDAAVQLETTVEDVLSKIR